MIPRSLSPDDFSWALDHSRRRYRVREARQVDIPNAKDLDLFITVIPIGGGTPILMAASCAIFPEAWRDDDEYACDRLSALAKAGAFRHRRSGRLPEAVRLGYDFGNWCVELLHGDRLVRRTSFDTLEEARAAAHCLEAAGLRRLPDACPALPRNGGA